MTYQEDDSLDKMRKEIQESLIESKRERLQDEYGMVMDHASSDLSPQAHNEWLDYILEWERQIADGKRITVRERIGDPPITPVEEIPANAHREALDRLLEMLFEQNIVVDFLGEWDDPAAYRYITEELLDEEMDDIQIEGSYVHFDTATPEYDVQMWVEEFAWDVFNQEREYFLPGLKKQPLFDEKGAPLTFAAFATKLEAVWARLPATKHVDVIPSKIEVAGTTASVVASIAWTADSEPQQIDAFFRLQPSPYGGWDVVHTSLLDDLLALVST